MAKTVILGYYGFQNTGDEALLEAIVGSLRDQYPGIEIAVLSADAGEYPNNLADSGVIAVNRWHPLRILGALRQADLLVVGGGTLLQDATSLRSLAYYVGIVLLARRMGKRVMFFANGLGPLSTRTGRWLTRQALQAADAITLRDTHSLRKLEKWYPDLAGRARLTADPALLLKPMPNGRARALLTAAGLPEGRRFIAVCVRPWHGVSFEAPLAEALDTMATRHGTATVFLPMQMPRDVEVSRRVMARMLTPAHLVAQPTPPRVFMSMLEQAHAVVAMRLHAAILAAALQRPAFGIAYDPKVEGVVSDLGLPILNRPEELTAERLAETLDDLIERHDAISGTLRERLVSLRALARENAATAAALLRPQDREREPR